MKNFIIIILVMTMIIVSCTNPSFQKTSNGMVVNNGEDAVLIEVFAPEIIHVFAFKGLQMPDKNSLIVNESSWSKVSWSVSDQNGNIVLRTDNLQVSVDKSSLQVRFSDKNGNLILSEKKNGGREFRNEIVNNDSVLAVRQSFEDDKEQALYGLGQHQDRLMNIRGREISFNQRNREIFVPFLVSTKGFGILWDNYSWTRFGSLLPSEKIPSTLWYDLSGKFGGLTAEWFTDGNWKNKINIGQNQAEPLDYPSEIANKFLSARYEGELEIPVAGEYQLENKGKQYFRLWIDGNLVRDYWSSFVLATDYTRLELDKGKHKIKMEWGRSNPDEMMTLTWRTPSMHEDNISLWSQAGKGIDYYFVHGETMDEVLAGYRMLTGSASILPRWAYGFWQSRERYQTQDELVSVVEEFRKKKVPLDVIVQDWQYWKPGEWGSHLFDKTRFQDPKTAFEKIHDMNARVMISVWPKFYTNVRNFKELNDKGYIYPYNLQDSTRDWLGFVSSYYDAYNPKARDLYWEQLNKTLVPTGVDAWWLDASEPEVVSDASPADMAQRMSPNFFGTGVEFLNAYPLFHSRGIYEHQRKSRPEGRVCILTRSAFAGQQANGAISWSGDIASRWDVLKAQIECGLQFSISGIPYWTTDIGAFSVDYPDGNANPEYQELFTRWYQFGTFCPIFRVHGTNTPREIWFFGDENDPPYQSQLFFSKLRYRLLPYIYSLAGAAFHKHYTIMRPLAMDFSSQKMVWDIPDQYMFGPDFMVCPVTDKGAVDRPVYLPAGKGWYDFWFGQYTRGGNSISASAPFQRMPLFIRAGSILPLGPELQYVDEKSADTLQLLVYTGDNASFELYEDEGTNYNYEQGKYSVIPISWNEDSRTLEIGDRKGEYLGMLKKRVFNITFITPQRPQGFVEMGKPDKLTCYEGKALKVAIK